MIFGDIDGNLHFLSRQLAIESFKAYEIRVSHLYQLKQHNILVSIGEDEEGINPLIKVWHLEKVACLTVHENLNYMAVGFENGAVVLFKGDVTRDRHSKQRVIYEGQHSITGLYFKPQSHGKSVVLYVTTQHHVMAITLGPKEKDTSVNVLDQHGCKPGCCVLSDHQLDHQFIIGRTEAVYFYEPDDRGQCLAFEGEKLNLQWFRGYLVIVGKEKKAIPMAGPSKTMDMHLVTVYDVQNKFIAYSGPVPEVSNIMCEWGSLYCLGGDRKLYQLQEKDTQTKLEILFKKNLYQLAIDLAQGQQYDQDGIIDIFRQYGDHLYGKGDHDGAIQQYIKTIGKLEASYVIRKFLDAQRIHNLTAYLQALHQAHLATEDHTTLLLNCYTKLKDVTTLDQFIMSKNREIEFDVETAIRVCRSAGYYTHALYLSEQHQQHNWYLKIQLEDIRDHQRALEYMGKLEFYEAELNAKKYGKELMAAQPTQTTDFLKRLCTDYKPSQTPLVDEQSLAGGRLEVAKARAEEFIHVFVNNGQKLTEFLEHMVQVEPSCSALVYNTLLELYLHDLAHDQDMSARVERERKTLDLLQSHSAGYDLDQALVLCQMNSFKAGILFLYEKAKLYQQILKYHMDHDDYSHVMETCKKFGTSEPNLWIQALSFFAGKEENCKTQIAEVLSHIDKWNLLPPLLVIQTLAHNSTATLGVVKEYMTRRLQQEQEQMQEDERLIQQYQAETDKMRGEIDQLKTSATIFNVSKCSVCSHPLELPSVHFLCQHSYHQHCFESYAENETECPACLPENRKVLEIIRAQEQGRDLHEQFHHQLERAQDGFSVIADYFGRGVFNKVTLVTDSPQSKMAARPRQVSPPPSNMTSSNASSFPSRTDMRSPMSTGIPKESSNIGPGPPTSWAAGRQSASQPARQTTNQPPRQPSQPVRQTTNQSPKQPANPPSRQTANQSPRQQHRQPVTQKQAAKQTTSARAPAKVETPPSQKSYPKAYNPFDEDSPEKDYPKEYNPFD